MKRWKRCLVPFLLQISFFNAKNTYPRSIWADAEDTMKKLKKYGFFAYKNAKESLA